MWRQIPDHTIRLALRRLFSAYLAISGSALFFPHRPEAWPLLALVHVVGVLLLLQPRSIGDVGRSLAERWPRGSAVLADWYALALMPLLYAELPLLSGAVHGGRYFDGWVQGWELWLFGSRPSQELAMAFPGPVLSEVLHFFYLSYYLIIFGPPLYLYLSRRITAHQRMVFALMLTFFGHYLFFVFFPVQGPRYLFPAPGGELSQGVMYRLAHAVLEAGSSQGAAFPSSHVGVAVAQTAMAFLVWRRAAPALAVASAGLAVGAVYGGFHYATDAVGGLLMGLALFAAAPWLAMALGKSGGGDGAGRPQRDSPLT